MYENLGVTFTKIRDEKKSTVRENVRNNKVSESHYYRFVIQESEIDLTKFLNLLENLNVQLEEFTYLLPESKMIYSIQKAVDFALTIILVFNLFTYRKTYSFVSPLTD